jgi:ComF family protein
VNTNPYYPTPRDAVPSWPRHVADAILNLFYPDCCFICSSPIARHQESGICGTCWERIEALRLRRPWCPLCGLPLPFPEGTTEEWLCGECTTSPPPFSGARSFGYYTAELSKAIQEFKFHGRRNLTAHLAPLLARSFSESWRRDEIDMVIPVPLHPRRKRQRGFNQSELLARSLASLLALPCRPDSLARVRYTEPQVGLRDPERLRNVQAAFRCVKPGLLARRRVLLIDDVMTTGATVRSAASVLMRSGTLRVSVLTVARAVPGQ